MSDNNESSAITSNEEANEVLHAPEKALPQYEQESAYEIDYKVPQNNVDVEHKPVSPARAGVNEKK